MADRHKGSSIDDFLREEGVLEKFQTGLANEVTVGQIAQAIKERGLSKRRRRED